MEKFQKIFNNSEFCNENFTFKCTSVIKYDNAFLGKCGIFFTNNYILILNEDITKIIYYYNIQKIDKKDQVISRKLVLDIPVDYTKLELDFKFDKDRQLFLKNLHMILGSKKSEFESYIGVDTLKKWPKGYIPFEELKTLRQLFDLELISEEEYLITKSDILKDYF